MSAHNVRKSRRFKRDRAKYHRHKQQPDVEFSQEAGAFADTRKHYGIQGSKINHGSGMGILAVIFSVLSFFLFTLSLGIGGAVLGMLAYLQGSRSLGRCAIVAGILAIFVKFVTIMLTS